MIDKKEFPPTPTEIALHGCIVIIMTIIAGGIVGYALARLI